MTLMPPEETLPEYRVTNVGRGVLIASRVRIAGKSADRRKGLLGLTSMPDGFGLWIAPCEAIHTFGMKMPIDALFLDARFRVRKAVKILAPRRLSLCVSAASVLEVEAGAIGLTGTEAGDILQFEVANSTKEMGVCGR